MNHIKNVFSIKDLENLSGIKAHTIRIWEKRYGLLKPMRTDTNIRLYDLGQLRKLLNVVLLHDHGYKISKIADFPEDKIPQLAGDIISKNSVNNQAINQFKIAMMHFDQALFVATYEKLLSEESFRDVFHGIFLPLLQELGLLWQSQTISPAHEHFISYQIQQKLLVNIERLQMAEPTKKDKVFVLYLPENEIHQLGLLYLNYELLLHGYKTVYLGESVPIESLKDLKKHFDNLIFVTYLTIEPQPDRVTDYITKVREEMLGTDARLWFTGRLAKLCDTGVLNDRIKRFGSIGELVNEL